MNGFFNQEALEALQKAYEMQLTPEEQDIDTLTGLPTNVVSNTSPWANDVELWKYPDGKNKLETSPILFTKSQVNEEEIEEEAPAEEEGYYDSEEQTEEEGSQEDDEVSDEEIEALIQEILSVEDDDFVDDDEQG